MTDLPLDEGANMRKHRNRALFLCSLVTFAAAQVPAVGGEKPFYGLNFSPYLESQSPDLGSRIGKEQVDAIESLDEGTVIPVDGVYESSWYMVFLASSYFHPMPI